MEKWNGQGGYRALVKEFSTGDHEHRFCSKLNFSRLPLMLLNVLFKQKLFFLLYLYAIIPGYYKMDNGRGITAPALFYVSGTNLKSHSFYNLYLEMSTMPIRLKVLFSALSICLLVSASAQPAGSPDKTFPWWKKNSLRVIQVNLPAYEAATLDPDSLVQDLVTHAANAVIINAGGIMAFYPSKLDFHYINPYMKPEMLGKVVENCHRNGIKVIVRFDFSRIDRSIFEAHPDWAYVDRNGEQMINTDKYVTCINAPYMQEKAFEIIAEVIRLYPVDGIFQNMPGYQVNNAYIGKYHGIDQNEHDKKRFYDFSGGMTLPLEENPRDPVFVKYQEFKKFTTEEWQDRLHKLVKSMNPNIAICTYATKNVDMIRHESQTNTLPYFPYNASDNVNVMMTSYPDHIVSNASIQQISFQSRYNAIEPEEMEIRLWENIANGSGLDMSMMGDLRNYEDERNFSVMKKVYGHHRKFEKYYGRYRSLARVAVVAPGWWPHGNTMQEYRGIQLMLQEAHIPFDRIEDSQLGARREDLKKYSLILLPDIHTLNPESADALESLAREGISLVATNQTLRERPDLLNKWFGVRPKNRVEDCSGQYLEVPQDGRFPSLPGQKMIFLKFNLGEYDMISCDEYLMPLLSKGRPGPPEMIGGHDSTGYYGIGLKKYTGAMNAILPLNLGKLYYLHGYEQHKHLFLDLLRRLLPSLDQDMMTNAHPRIETILREFDYNEEAAFGKPFISRGRILHLINLSGFSGNTYFEPMAASGLFFEFPCEFIPTRVWTMSGQKVSFKTEKGKLKLDLAELQNYEGIVIER